MALRIGCRALGEEQPQWQPPEIKHPLVIPFSAPLPIRFATRKGLHTSVGRASTAILEQIEHACNHNVDDLRSVFASNIRNKPSDAKPRMRRTQNVGDMMVNPESEAEVDRLYSLLHIYERQGRFADIPMARLAQAIIPFADPHIFLKTPRPCRLPELWPVEAKLDELLTLSTYQVGGELGAIIEADLETSVRLIGGVVRIFSDKWDVKATLDHVIYLTPDQDEDRRPSVLAGRASFSLEEQSTMIRSQGAKDQIWLTQFDGGLLPFVDATLDLFPGRCWKDLGWVPDPRDPLVWRRDGNRVAWFEKVLGPVRTIYPSDFVYRQPTVARWVCTSDEWLRIAEIFGDPQRRIQLERALVSSKDQLD